MRKLGLCAQNTLIDHSHYATYLTLCVSYTTSVKFIEFPIVCCTSTQQMLYWLPLFKQKVDTMQSLQS